MELKDTVDLMLSEDYKDRFRAEYHQTKERYEKLRKMLIKHDAGTLAFTPACPIGWLRLQARQMDGYLHTLEMRSEIEEICLIK